MDDQRFKRLQDQLGTTRNQQANTQAKADVSDYFGDKSQGLDQPVTAYDRPVIPSGGMGMNQAQGQLFDQARASVGGQGAPVAPTDYDTKMSALQSLAGKAPNPLAAKDIYQQMDELKKNKPGINYDDLEEVQ
jgi:hypothetical protein